MLYMDVVGDPAYLHTDVGPLEWNSQTWVGVGSFAIPGPVREDESLDANETQVGLRFASRDAAISVAAARSTNHRGRRAIYYAAARDLVSGALVGNPVILLDGEMQSLDFEAGREGGTTVLTILDGRSDDDRTIHEHFSNVHFQERHTGDLAAKFMDDAVLFRETWGPGGPSANQTYTGGSGTPTGVPGVSATRRYS